MEMREKIARKLVDEFKLEFFDKKELLELVDWYRIADRILTLFPLKLSVEEIEEFLQEYFIKNMQNEVKFNTRDLAHALAKMWLSL